MISVKQVSKLYKSKQGTLVAVDDVNLNIQDGEIFGVIGYSGAGKSTLLRMLNGLERPTAGAIHVGEQKISAIKGKDLRQARQKIGMIFQHFNLLWSRTVFENIAFPLEIAGIPKKERVQKVNELIKLVGLEGREKSYPSQLSGGQKQRVGIARALANDPQVLLCDEATSALDPQTTDSILDLLVSINEKLGLTIILITHEMHVIQKICHRVAVMESGKIVELGSVLDVFKNPQQPVTKRFVKQVTESDEAKETIDHLLEQYSEGEIVKLSFVGENAEKPIITSIIRDFPVSINILQGKISHTQHGSYGSLIIHVNGNDEDIQKVLSFLTTQQVGTEVLTHV